MKRVLLFIPIFFLSIVVNANEDRVFGWNDIRDNISVIDTVVPQTFEYVQYKERSLSLDLYRPKEARADSACVVFIFGGGFFTGSPKDKAVRNYCQKLAREGYTAVAIDYRLYLAEIDKDTVTLFNMQRVFKTAINNAAADASAAIAYLCAHASEWGVSKERVVLCGSSAGAIAALQLDYCRCNDLWPAATLPAGWKPAAVVSFAGGVYSERGNPKYAKCPAPTFFLHGDMDKIVNYKKFPPILRKGLYGSKKLHRTFEKKDYPHWFFSFDGLGHEVASVQEYMFEEFVAFVNKVLQGKQMHYDAVIRDDYLKPTKWSKMNVFDLYE